MLVVVLIITAAIAVTALFMLLLVYRGISKIAENLKEINAAETNQTINLPSPDRHLEKLAVEINHALTKRQKAEAKYKQMDQRQRRDIANISHDLRTPLTSVIGYIQLLEDDSLTPDERQKYKDILFSRAKSLEHLIGGFYDLSRLENGEYHFNLEKISLQNILSEILASFYNDFLQKGITPQINIDEKAPLVIADADAVRRVFTNLIQNVVKHCNGNFNISLKQGKDQISIQFSNDAPELSQNDVEHLFERFYTADRMRSGQNTGLGLAIVKELVKKMNGSVVASLENQQLCIIIKWQL